MRRRSDPWPTSVPRPPGAVRRRHRSCRIPDPDRAGGRGSDGRVQPRRLATCGRRRRWPGVPARRSLGCSARSARGVGIRFRSGRKGAGPGNHASPQGDVQSRRLAAGRRDLRGEDLVAPAPHGARRRRVGRSSPQRPGPVVGCVHARRPVAGRGGVQRRSCVRRPHRDAAEGATGYRSGQRRCREPRREPARRGIGLKKRGRRCRVAVEHADMAPSRNRGGVHDPRGHDCCVQPGRQGVGDRRRGWFRRAVVGADARPAVSLPRLDLPSRRDRVHSGSAGNRDRVRRRHHQAVARARDRTRRRSIRATRSTTCG